MEQTARLERSERGQNLFARREHHRLMKLLGVAEIDCQFRRMRPRGEVANHGAAARRPGDAGIERHDREVGIAGADLVEIYPRGRGGVGKNRGRGRTVREQIDFRRAMRSNQCRSESRRARGYRHRHQIVERLAQIGPVRRLRMADLRLERVCDHAELVANRSLIDYFQRVVTRLVQPRAGAVVRAHPGAEIEHQRVAAAVTG